MEENGVSVVGKQWDRKVRQTELLRAVGKCPEHMVRR